MLHKIRTQRLLGTNVNELTVSCIYSQSPTTVARVKRLVASVILCVCVCVCLHDKTKTAETKIIRLGTWKVNYESSPTN